MISDLVVYDDQWFLDRMNYSSFAPLKIKQRNYYVNLICENEILYIFIAYSK